MFCPNAGFHMCCDVVSGQMFCLCMFKVRRRRTRAHAHTQAHTQTYRHTYIQSHAYTGTYTHTKADTHTNTQIYSTGTQIYSHTHTRAHTHSHTDTHTNTDTKAHTHTDIQAHIQYIQSHTYTGLAEVARPLIHATICFPSPPLDINDCKDQCQNGGTCKVSPAPLC